MIAIGTQLLLNSTRNHDDSHNRDHDNNNNTDYQEEETQTVMRCLDPLGRSCTNMQNNGPRPLIIAQEAILVHTVRVEEGAMIPGSSPRKPRWPRPSPSLPGSGPGVPSASTS